MRPDSYYAPEGDIAYIKVRPAHGQVSSREEKWGLRDLDETGALVGLEIWDASSRLPEELIAALPHLDGRELTVQRQTA